MNNLLQAAQQYRSMGLSITVVNDHKKSLYTWRKYQHRLITQNEILTAFNHSAAAGIAIICGKISGNLEVIDLDQKNDLQHGLFEHFITAVNNYNPTLLTQLVIASTKNAGYHFFYRCSKTGNHSVLAQRPCTAEELAANPKHKVKVLIEKMGDGSYIIVPPTPGYQFIQHDLNNIPLIQPFQRQILLDIGKSFNQYYEPKLIEKTASIFYTGEESPFNDYNNRGDIVQLLERHGWTVTRKTTIKTYFRRPGNTDHETSGDYNHQLGLFGVFSTSTEFKLRTGYRPYAVYAILECGGNFKLAAKRLLAEGYGTPYSKRRTDPAS
jgi:hypothetical protein